MADVVQKSCSLYHLCLPSPKAEALAEASRDVANANRMLEAGMKGARVDEVGHSQLADPAQSLENRAVDGFPLGWRQLDHSMNGIADGGGLGHKS